MSLVEQTTLYKKLEKKCESGLAKHLNTTKFLSMVSTAADEMGKLLNRTCENFPDYTLHDEQHAIRVIRVMDRILGDKLTDKLTPVDLVLLILSAYGHDVGMAAGRERREELRDSEEFKDFLLRNEDAWIEAENAREAGHQEMCEHLSSQLFQDFLRGKHHILSAELMTGEFASYMQIEGNSLARPVADLCRSHGQSIEELSTYHDFPFAGCFQSDIQFLACVLRLADYLDLDPARAPKTLMALIVPGSEKSRREWRKHQANNFYVDSHSVKFTAAFEDFFEEKALRDTLVGIEEERRACMEFLRARTEPGRLKLTLENPLKKEIESKGYIFEEFCFQLEYKEIIALLMGTRLYKDERVFVRELLQNSLDACRHSEAAALAANRPGYAGKIVVRKYRDDSDQEILEVTDNGAGMTRRIIRDYFMRVGRSYYQSFGFKRKRLALQPVSQFGIGILSCFMKADYIEVETMPDPLVYDGAEDSVREGLKLEIRGPHEFFVVHRVPDARPGTTVRVHLNSPLVGSTSSLVERFLIRTPYTVEIHDLDAPAQELQNRAFDFTDDRFAHYFVTMPGAFGYAERDVDFDGRFGFELKGRIRLFMLESNNRRYLQLHNAGKYSFVGFTPHGDTLINTHILSEEILRQFNERLNQIRVLKGHFSPVCQSDIGAILSHFDRVCDLLMHQHGSAEVTALWEALRAQVEALKKSTGFQSNTVCVKVSRYLSQTIHDVESFVTGQLLLSCPDGLLTQDGINLTAVLNLPSRLQFGIGYLFNLDLCGKYRLTLNAARDSVLLDDKYDSFVRHLHSKVGAELAKWFREEEVPQEQIDQYITSVPKSLAEAVAAGLDAHRRPATQR